MKRNLQRVGINSERTETLQNTRMGEKGSTVWVTRLLGKERRRGEYILTILEDTKNVKMKMPVLKKNCRIPG